MKNKYNGHCLPSFLVIISFLALNFITSVDGFILATRSNINGFVVPSSISSSSTSTSTTTTRTKMIVSNNEVEDNSIIEYSRSLTREEELDQINDELALSRSSIWRKIKRKSIRGVKKVASKIGGTERVSPGALILVRAGESEFSKNFTFTGWADPELVEEGQLQMEHCSRLLYESGYADIIDVVYTSRLKRAIKSAWIIIQEISAPFLPIYKSWRLNERHYGKLTGLSKQEAAKTLGSDVVQAWRRSLKARPPPVSKDDQYYPGNKQMYSDLLPSQVPTSESLADCMDRTRPLWEFKIRRDLKRGKNVMVVAHANTIRGLAKIIDEIDDEQITEINIPKGIPFVYKFDKKMNAVTPDAKALNMIHTKGTFLENPGLLERSLRNQKLWYDNVPGSPGESDIPNVAKRETTLERALLKLKEEKESWSQPTDNEDSVYQETDNVYNVLNGDDQSSKDAVATESEDFRFEQNRGKTIIDDEEIHVNWSSSEYANEPVVVLVRHGKTPHNKLKLFTGWEDPELAIEGVEEAREAGRLLKKHGFTFDVVYTSWLYRAIQTAWLIMGEMDMLWIPMIKTWRLNERHYGDLTGKSKKMVANIYGDAQLKKWRKSHRTRPPPVSSYSFQYPGNDIRRTKYVSDLRISFTETICRSIENRRFELHRKFPKGESLKDCMGRSLPFYTQKIVPQAVAKNKRVLIASHENAIRGILMELCEIPEENMNDLHLPNGVPLIYNVKRKCISLLPEDDDNDVDVLKKYDFGSAAKFLFKPCEIGEDEDWYEIGQKIKQKKQMVDT